MGGTGLAYLGEMQRGKRERGVGRGAREKRDVGRRKREKNIKKEHKKDELSTGGGDSCLCPPVSLEGDKDGHGYEHLSLLPRSLASGGIGGDGDTSGCGGVEGRGCHLKHPCHSSTLRDPSPRWHHKLRREVR